MNNDIINRIIINRIIILNTEYLEYLFCVGCSRYYCDFLRLDTSSTYYYFNTQTLGWYTRPASNGTNNIIDCACSSSFYAYKYKHKTFEEVLDDVPKEVQVNLLFHLDIFTKKAY
jgi:hypothetical protein